MFLTKGHLQVMIHLNLYSLCNQPPVGPTRALGDIQMTDEELAHLKGAHHRANKSLD